jgi:hypothetical protein
MNRFFCETMNERHQVPAREWVGFIFVGVTLHPFCSQEITAIISIQENHVG